ncbi:LytR C-terminal domain-containing protein [Actinokineospora sp. NBRC 105648]|uniref:caspase, EACC1-associated type n=1 Tax=Actinokineospora sp. NBRC 105648 TaxID=3032206 RepID=UPI0025535F52|nr:LytR C-terminal domain-containing protein [Actinokineospora sp. NBRC 105648]
MPDPARSSAILIGTSRHTAPELPDLAGVVNNLDGLQSALTDPRRGGFLPERCTVVDNADSVRAVYRALRKHTGNADDTVFVYFAGHGLLSPDRGDLYLTLPDTHPDELRVSALPFEVIRDVLRDSPAVNRVLVLDCCFSGRATAGTMAAALSGQVEVEGTYTLASAPANAVALAPPGARYTAFTGGLIRLLRDGVAGGPELLSLEVLYAELRRMARAAGRPMPSRLGTGTANQLALVRNGAWTGRTAIPTTPPARAPRRALWITAAAVGLAGGVTAAVLATNALVDEPAGTANPAPTVASTGPTTSAQQAGTTTTVERSATTTTSTTATATTTSSAAVAGTSVVRVYNNSTIAGLGNKAKADFRERGWTVSEVSNYTGGRLPTSTVYYRPGTEEEPAALNLAGQFHLQPLARPESLRLADPGVIVIVTSDYQG